MSNITNLNRDYLIKINVKEATIDVPKMTFWNTDKKTSNMFVQLVINMSENELIKNYVTIENATDYKITLNVIKPKTNQYRTFEAKLLNEEKALFEIDLPDEFTDQVGEYSFEFEVSSKVDSNDESITTSNGTYKVNGSILTNLNQEISSSPDLPILKQLIEQVKSLQGGDLTGYQKKSDNSLETTSKEVVGAINEVNSQYKDIAKKVENVGSPTDEQMETAVNSYFGKHPITGGLTNAQISALNEMFKVCAYIKNDISTEYNNFKTAFKIGLKNYTITNNLANCTSSNSITSVQEGSSYNATITANNNYILQAPTITMGGTDVTSSVYSNGVISITKVTGNIVITCNAIEKTANTYSITNNLNGCTTNNNNISIVENSSYSATITANSAYDLGQITVTMGGVDITSIAVSGSNINITSVTGNIIVTCTSTLVTYIITNKLTNCVSNNNVTSVNKNSSYNATITPSTDYTLTGATVTITMGGTDVTSTVYNNGNINVTKVTGNIVITCSAIKEIKPELLKDVATLDKETSTATGTWHKTQCRYKLSVKVGDIITIANTRYSYNNNQCQLFVYDGTNTNSDFYKPYCVLNDDNSVSYTVQADADTFYVSFVPDDTKSNIIRANS